MRENELVVGILRQILAATELVLQRFLVVGSPLDFSSSPSGREKLDAICLPLSAIGECLKKIDKITGGELLFRYPSVDWKGAKATRDIIVHGYFDIDCEIVFDICKNMLPSLAEVIRVMIDDLE